MHTGNTLEIELSYTKKHPRNLAFIHSRNVLEIELSYTKETPQMFSLHTPQKCMLHSSWEARVGLLVPIYTMEKTLLDPRKHPLFNIEHPRYFQQGICSGYRIVTVEIFFILFQNLALRISQKNQNIPLSVIQYHIIIMFICQTQKLCSQLF